jgi:hypothetical protein
MVVLLVLTPSLSASTANVYGAIPENDYYSLSSGFNLVDVYGTESLNLATNDLSSGSNDPWFYANFNISNGDNYTGYSMDYVVSSFITGASSSFSGTVSGNVYNWSGTAFSEYNNMVVATLRSRGISLFENSATSNSHGPVYEVNSGGTVSGLSALTMVCSGQYSGVTSNPYETFLLSGVTKDNDNFSFEVSLSAISSKFITKVLGVDNFGKSRQEVPIFVEESYPASLAYAYNQSYIRGLDCELIGLPGARTQDPSSIAYNLEKYQSPMTPYLVSELRGNKVYKLFRFISISDGDSANVEIKVSIANLSFNNMTFDVLVRSFFDTDANPVVIEKFTNCVMDPASNNFVAKKIGSSNGEFALISKYIMVEMSDEAPIDALPCGFYGYTQREYASITNPSPVPKFKTKYYFPGEVIYNPPFGTTSGGDNTVESAGDIVRRSYLGFSSQFGVDESFLTYKGKQNPLNWIVSPVPVEGMELLE